MSREELLVEVGQCLIERWCNLGGDDCEVHDHGPFMSSEPDSNEVTSLGYEDERGEVKVSPTEEQWVADHFDGATHRTVAIPFTWQDVKAGGRWYGAPLLLSLLEDVLDGRV